MKILLTIFGIVLFVTAFGQDTSPNLIDLTSLELNGVSSNNIPFSIKIEDVEKLKSFDFSPFRLYSATQKIQIENGPIIELFSVEKMISIGTVFTEEYISSKKNVDFSTVTHSVMPKVNIGYGLIPAEVFH